MDIARRFVDIEASDSESEEEETEFAERDDQYEDWILERKEDDENHSNNLGNHSEVPEAAGPSASHKVELSENGRDHRDERMAAVITRYEVPGSGRQRTAESDSENEVITMLVERVQLIPSESDPGIWSVRMREGSETESFFLLHNRLSVQKEGEESAISVFVPPCRKGWICVESTSRENVEKLCINLSTFPHPLKISFLPVEERIEWLGWQPEPSPIKSPSWVRLKQRSKLKELLLNDPNFDEGILKYANDLAYVCGRSGDLLVGICLVLRLWVPIDSQALRDETDGDAKKRRKSKRVQRLLHPNILGNLQEAVDVSHLLDAKVWWNPKRNYELNAFLPGVYELIWPKNGQRVRGGDLFMPPFAHFLVPITAVDSIDVAPKLEELRLFSEGMVIGGQELQFPAPDSEFVCWTYENYVAAPLEVGQAVEARLGTVMVTGVVDEIRFDQVVVRLMDAQEEIEVDAQWVRRLYKVGDRVKVVRASNIDREGWVVNTRDDCIEIFDRKRNEQFVAKCWQVIPYDSFEWGTSWRIQQGDMVQVINPLAPQYQTVGRVCNVTNMFVEVTDSTNTMFAVPPWFLEVYEGHEMQAGSDRPDVVYDRYKELINTWVIVCGNHSEKGLYGRIREHLGSQIVRVEARSGSRLVDIHVDFLMTAEEGGRDLREYHVGLYPLAIPAGVGSSVASFIRRPERAKTPVPDELIDDGNAPAAESTTLESEAGEVGGAAPETRTENERGVTLAPKLELVLPKLELQVPTISYEGQVVSADWLIKHNLVTKRIYAHVRNSGPDVFGRGGYEKGVYEGDRVLVLSGDRVDAIQVHLRKRVMTIPGWLLLPQMPTRKGQDVVVISGDRAGEVYVTRKQKEDGSFPLSRKGFGGKPSCTLERSQLARCDPK